MSAIIKTQDISNELNAGSWNKVQVTAYDDDLGISGFSNEVSYSGGELTYTLASTGDYYICTGANNLEGTQLIIPSTHVGADGVAKEVREIGASAFASLTSIVSVSLPDTLTKINSGAFDHCTALTNIVIPKNVTIIGGGAFRYSGLKTVTFGSGSALTEIGASAFQSTPLATITLPNKLQIIGNAAFQSCSLKCDLVIPDSVTEIRGAAFSYSGVTGVYLGNCGVTTINMTTFANCKSLTEVRTNPLLETIDNKAFNNCESLTTVVFGGNVKWIGTQAFNGCTKLGTCNFEVPYGWFYTTETSVPDKISDGVTCTHVSTITPRMLSQDSVNFNFFRIDKMPAPEIQVVDGVLTITDYSGLADIFNIYINGKDPIPVFAKPVIEAGTWVANDNFALPTSTMQSVKLPFRSHNGATDITAAHEDFTGIKWQNYSPELGYYTMLSYAEGSTMGIANGVYTKERGWFRDECKTMVVAENTEVIEAFFNWYTANFTKID